MFYSSNFSGLFDRILALSICRPSSLNHLRETAFSSVQKFWVGVLLLLIDLFDGILDFALNPDRAIDDEPGGHRIWDLASDPTESSMIKWVGLCHGSEGKKVLMVDMSGEALGRWHCIRVPASDSQRCRDWQCGYRLAGLIDGRRIAGVGSEAFSVE